MTETTAAPRKPCPLLVLYHAIERERASGRHAVADELQQARNALAELVHADQQLVKTETAYNRATAGRMRNDLWHDVLAARTRRAFALERFNA